MDSGRRKVPWTTRPRHNVSRQPASLSKVTRLAVGAPSGVGRWSGVSTRVGHYAWISGIQPPHMLEKAFDQNHRGRLGLP
jgi:hypothetical protein